jgi:hypothetical protein
MVCVEAVSAWFEDGVTDTDNCGKIGCTSLVEFMWLMGGEKKDLDFI